MRDRLRVNPVLPAPHCRFSSSKNAGKVRTFILPPKGQTNSHVSCSCLSPNTKESHGNVETIEKKDTEKPRFTELQKETEKCESVCMTLIQRSPTLL
jgi:hypothetical protein